MTEEDIVIYSTPTCMYCEMLKSYLDQKGITYKDYNVADNKDKAKEMIQKTGQRSVPVTEIDGEVVLGFDKEKIEKILKQRGE